VLGAAVERLGHTLRSLHAIEEELARELARTAARQPAGLAVPELPLPAGDGPGDGSGDGTGDVALYHDLFEHAPEPYLVTDATGRILRCNAAADALAPHADHPLVGTEFGALLPPGERQALRRALQALDDVRGPTRLVLPLRLGGARAGTVWARAAVSVARDADGRAQLLRWLLHLLGERGASGPGGHGGRKAGARQ
jgi:PAS domain S-box-containing protein